MASRVTPDEAVAYLQMSAWSETPKAGKCRVVMDSLFDRLVEKELELRGYDVSAIKMEFEKQWYEHIGGSLTRIIVYLRNAGDLPTYAVKAKVTINQESKTVDIFRRPIPLGESSVEIHVYAPLLAAGSHPRQGYPDKL